MSIRCILETSWLCLPPVMDRHIDQRYIYFGLRQKDEGVLMGWSGIANSPMMFQFQDYRFFVNCSQCMADRLSSNDVHSMSFNVIQCSFNVMV